MEALTERQAAVLRFLREFFRREDRLPRTREIQVEFGMASQTGAMFHLRSLERKGFIENRNGKGASKPWWRFSREQSGPEETECPHLTASRGTAPAGQQSDKVRPAGMPDGHPSPETDERKSATPEMAPQKAGRPLSYFT